MITETTPSVYYDPAIQDMTEELTRLILRRDELRFHVSADLRTEYMLKVGSKELAVWRKSVEYGKEKRRLSLIRSEINRGVEPDLELVEEQLEFEFQEYQKKIEKRVEEMKELLQRMDGEVMTEEETKEFKDMYYKIVKNIHPDVNPEVTEVETEFFHMAVDAYKRGDMDKMRAIYWNVIEDKDVVIPEKDLKQKIMEVKADIDRIMHEFPFDKIDFLKDKEAVRERCEELDEMMRDYDEQLKIVRDALKAIGVLQ